MNVTARLVTACLGGLTLLCFLCAMCFSQRNSVTSVDVLWLTGNGTCFYTLGDGCDQGNQSCTTVQCYIFTHPAGDGSRKLTGGTQTYCGHTACGSCRPNESTQDCATPGGGPNG
jgi:hypothetical protein